MIDQIRHSLEWHREEVQHPVSGSCAIVRQAAGRPVSFPHAEAANAPAPS
ncbi:MAG: hypothetical protein ACLP0J_00575 [Solirubrobacteraceae bacterium]